MNVNRKVKRGIMVITAVVSMLECALNISAAPAVANGNFEKVAANGSPSEWIPLDFGWDVEKAGNFFIVSTDARSGKGAATIILNNYEKGWSAAPLSGLKPNTWYSLSLEIKGDLNNLSGRGATIFVLRHLPGKSRIGNAPDNFFGSLAMNGAPEEWRTVEVPFKTTEKTDHMFAAVGLYDALGSISFDNLSIKEIDEKTAEKIKNANTAEFAPLPKNKPGENLLINGSFEIMTAPYMPDGWTHAMHYAGYKRDFYDAVRVVDDNPFQGKHCLKLKNGQLRYVGAKVTKNDPIKEPTVISFYLRSDDPKASFTVFNKKFSPTPKWKRYSVNLPAGKKADFWIKTKGMVFIDAFKMETGSTPTTFSANYRDSILTAPLPPKVKSPEVELKQTITIDSFIVANGAKSSKPTRCVIKKKKDALQFRFECRGRSPEKLVAKINQRDDYLFTDDSVAVTINPGALNGETKPFIFEVNSLGVQRDSRGFDTTWDGTWKSVAGKLKDGYWVELIIPFAILNDPFATSTWRINLIRHSAATATEKREVSAWFNPGTERIEKVGVDVSGFTLADSASVAISAPVVKLAVEKRSAPSKLYAVEFELAFPDSTPHSGTATLAVDSKTLGFARWKSTSDKAVVSFAKFPADKLADFKNFVLIIKEKGKIIAEKFLPKRLSAPLPLIVGPLDRSYYTSEKNAGVKIEVNLTAELAEKFQLNIELLGSMKRLAAKRYPAKSGIVRFELPKLPAGVYTLKTNLTRANGGAAIIATRELPLNVLPPAKIEAKVNQITRMMVINGKSYINHGLSVSAQSRNLKPMKDRMTYLVPDIKEIVKRFNGISPLYATLDKNRDKTIPILKDLVEKFHTAGLDVTMTIPQMGTVKSFDPGGDFFKDHFDALKKYKMRDWPVMAWYQFDETYNWWEKNPNNKESDLLDFYWKLKAFDPYRLFYTDTCHCGQIYGGVDHADWIGGSYYPIALYPPSNVVAGVRGAAMATEKTRAKTDARIVTGGFLPCFAWERGREPSPEEYKACVYVMLAHGCRAMNLWMYSVLSKELWDGMIPLKKELAYLSPIFADGEDVSAKVAGSNPAIDHVTYKYGDATYILAVNYTQRKQTGAFDTRLLGHFANIADAFGTSTPKLKNGVVTAEFEPYGCRVFKLK